MKVTFDMTTEEFKDLVTVGPKQVESLVAMQTAWSRAILEASAGFSRDFLAKIGNNVLQAKT